MSDNDRNSIHFWLNDERVSVTQPEPTETLLQFVRNKQRLMGTKEGCAEGDCGACTVIVGDLVGSELTMKSLNACIQFLPALDGKVIYTVEYLKQPDNSLHPVQQAMVDHHGSQCGFCTPGFVMSLWGVYVQRQGKETPPPSRDKLAYALSGNLCRCTGYKPILDAGQAMFELPKVPFDHANAVQQLQQVKSPDSLRTAGFYSPHTLAELVSLKAEHPQALILAGGTDVGLWVTKQMQTLDTIIYLGNVAELQRLTETDDWLEIGAAVTLTEAYARLEAWYPVAELAERFASVPIRNAGTFVGNVANGSPIGDTPPWLMAVGSEVVLTSVNGERIIALDTLYTGYRQQSRRENEIISAVRVPRPQADQVFRTWKVSKRYDSDISAVCGAFQLTLDGNRITAARVAYGGMAATVHLAEHCEKALVGQPWNETTVQAAMKALSQDYQPLSDMRATASYRQLVAANLLYRFFLETAQPSGETLTQVRTGVLIGGGA